MNWFWKLIKNYYLVAVLVLGIGVLGLVSLSKLPADLLPQYNTPAVQIVTFYPGMPPVVMERDIMSRLERWTGQSVGIEHQEAKAMLGVCIVKDFFREDISLDTAMAQVTSYAMSDMFYLPPGTIPPMVMPFDPTASVPLCLVSVSSPSMNEKELYDVAYYELRNRLQSIQGVVAPAVYGGVLRRILAYVDPKALEFHNLSPLDVAEALQKQNIFIPTGSAKFGDIEYQVIANSMAEHVEDLNDFPIKADGDAVVFMRDIAKVKDSNQIQSNVVRINGKRQVYIPIYRQPGANTIEIVDRIQDQLERILQRLKEMDPKAKDLALEVVMDQSVNVRSSIRSLEHEGLLGAFLAGLVVLVFLRSWRSTLITIIAIPLSIMAAFIGIFFTDNTINSMTLGGLALSIGILVDQAIVVVENISRHLAMGKSRWDATVEGVSEVILPVGVATLTFFVIFFPVVFLSGMARYLFQPLAITVCFAMIGSYFTAMVVVPAFCSLFLKVKKDAHTEADESPGETKASGGWFDKLLGLVLRMKLLVIGLAMLAFAGAGYYLANVSGRELFPQVDSNQFTIYVRLPSGTRIEKTEEALAKIEQALIDEIGAPDPEFPKVEKAPGSNMRILISNAGVLMDWPAAYTPNSGPMDAFVLVQLKGKKGMPTTFDYVNSLRAKLGEQFPGMEFAFDTGGMMTAALNFGLPSPIDIQVSGSSLDTSMEIAGKVADTIRAIPGAVDVRIAQRLDYPQIKIEVDRVKALQLGVTQEEVVKNVVTAINSSINFKPAFWIDERNGNHYFIGAQYSEDRIQDLDTLLDIPITGPNSERPVSLRNIATLSRTTGPAVVNHRNITRIVNIHVNVEQGHDVGGVVEDIENALAANPELAPEEKETPNGVIYEVGGDYGGKGYLYEMRGEVRQMREALNQFSRGLLIAIVLVYLVMVAQLRSFVTPFIILVTVPLGFIGVAAMMYLTATPLSIPAFMGIIMMAGLVVQYSVILVDFANRLVDRGMSVPDAARDATRIRLRPILMTSFAAWLALLPMAIGGPGVEANAPLARAIIGGVLAATVLTLTVVPCLYVLLKRPARVAIA
ncbi:MAG: efflux RND transporter permease subunit [Opitutales bacterium]